MPNILLTTQHAPAHTLHTTTPALKSQHYTLTHMLPMLQHTHTKQPLTADCPLTPAQQECHHSAGCFSDRDTCAKVYTHMSLQCLTTTRPHTHTWNNTQLMHFRHTFRTVRRKGPAQKHTHLQQIHINAAASSFHNTRIACTLTYTSNSTNPQSSRQTWRRTRVCKNQHTHTQQKQRATQSRQHTNAYTHRDT